MLAVNDAASQTSRRCLCQQPTRHFRGHFDTAGRLAVCLWPVFAESRRREDHSAAILNRLRRGRCKQIVSWFTDAAPSGQTSRQPALPHTFFHFQIRVFPSTLTIENLVTLNTQTFFLTTSIHTVSILYVWYCILQAIYYQIQERSGNTDMNSACLSGLGDDDY